MPRHEIDLQCRVEYLSIVDPDGNVDQGLDPGLPDEQLLALYRGMLFGRRFDERMLILQRQGRIGTFALTKGQEAQVGATAALGPEDWLIPSFREMPSEAWKGKRPEDFLSLFAGYNEGGYIPQDVNMTPLAVPVGTQMLHAVGIGFGMKYRDKNNVTMTYFGDGATSEGDFHEAMNFAAVFQAPVIFMCQNNHWAISLPRREQTHSTTIAQKAVAYGVPGIQADGNDVLAMYVAAKEAVDRARSGGGPTLIEAVTYRMSLHTTADDPKKYRNPDEVKEWEKRDPIDRFRKYLANRGILPDEKAASIEEDVKEEIRKAEETWAARVKQPIDPLEMFENVFAEMPPSLAEQREELRLELEARKGEADTSAVVRD